MIPADRNLANAQTSAVGEKKQLDVEGKTIYPRRLQDRPANIEPKRLESALRIPERQASGDAHEKIENAAALFSPPRLMDPDKAAIQRA